MGQTVNACNSLDENPEGKGEHKIYIYIYGSIILKWILNRMGRCEPD
jgi:hypothetical protein